MQTADLINYVRDIGALGGTLTLEYNEGQVTLTGDELIFAADDYDMGGAFTIVAESEPVPWELQNVDEVAPVELGTGAKLFVAALIISCFAAIGLALL